MEIPVETLVELEGVDGERFDLTNGDRGIYLATDVKGLYDPPVKVVYEEPGNYPGARYLSDRILRRDMTFGVEILNDKGRASSWVSRDSEWRKTWSFKKDSKLFVTTPESGTRYLKCRLGASPEISTFTDPHLNTINEALMTTYSGDPFWYEDDVVYTAVTRVDTRFQPTVIGSPWPWDKIPTETLTIKVDPSDGRGGLNPTDQYIWPKWIVPASQEPVPGFNIPIVDFTVEIPWGEAPFAQYTIPDFSFEDPAQRNRVIKTPGLVIGEDCVIDTDPRQEQYTSASGSQVWARTNGVRFRNPIPPWTKSCTYNIGVTGCAPGQLITLRLPRPWTRPWGLE